MTMYFKLRKTQLEDNSISFHPRVPITLSNAGKSKTVIAVLDTGSDLIYIPRDIAEYFKLCLSKECFDAKTPDSKMKYFLSKIQIEIKKAHESLKDVFQVIVPEDSLHNEIILGVPFLSRFTITFDYANERMILKKAIKKQ